MTELPAEHVLLESVREIESLGIPYAVLGGFAARAWGLPRPTFDADIAVAVDDDSLQTLLAAFEVAGFDVPPEHVTGYVDSVGDLRKVKVNKFSDGQVWTTDLFLVTGPFLQEAMRRAQTGYFGVTPVQVMTPEDIVLLKLAANRRKDLADIDDIIAVQPNMDLGYLRRWAEFLDLSDRLAEFFG